MKSQIIIQCLKSERMNVNIQHISTQRCPGKMGVGGHFCDIFLKSLTQIPHRKKQRLTILKRIDYLCKAMMLCVAQCQFSLVRLIYNTVSLNVLRLKQR